MTGRALLLLSVAALALISPAELQAWQLHDQTLKRIPLATNLPALTPETSADFDADGAPEILILTRGRAIIQTGDRIHWQSPEAWQVAQAQIADLNHDGFPEAVLLVWRPFKPWPVDAWLPNGGRIEKFHDSDGRSCHIILIGWKQTGFGELWAGSAMANPVSRFTVADFRGNGQSYLVTLEGEYDDPPSAPSRRLKVWEWNGFGFTVVNELDDSFNLMVTAQTEDGQVLILAH